MLSARAERRVVVVHKSLPAGPTRSVDPWAAVRTPYARDPKGPTISQLLQDFNVDVGAWLAPGALKTPSEAGGVPAPTL